MSADDSRFCDTSGCINIVKDSFDGDESEEIICDECREMVKRMERPLIEVRIDDLEARMLRLEKRVGRLEKS